jgi:MFS family permease
VAGASAILGLFASGLLLEVWSWRAVFGLNVALAAVAFVATLRVIPESADPDAPRLDVGGALISVAGLGLLVYSIIEAPTAGWTSARTVLGLIAGVLVLAGFVRWESRRADPLLDPALFGHRAFAAGTLSLTMQFFAFFGFIFLVLQYLQWVHHDSPLVAALSLIPMALAMMPFARILAPRLAETVGASRVVPAGLVLGATGLVVLAQLDATSGYWLLLAGLLPLGSGMGLAMTPATAAVTDALPVDKQGVGSAMNDLSRELGGALGIAVLGSVLQSNYRGGLDFSAGMHDALLAGAGTVLAAAIAVAVLLRRR